MHSSEALGVGLVGAGVIARRHMLAVNRLPDCRVVAICDKDERRAATVAHEWGIDRHYSEFSEMLDAETPSVVAILTPPQSHAELAVESLRRNVNTLIEKPFTSSLGCRESSFGLERQQGEAHSRLSLAFQPRHLGHALDLQETGALGEILGVDLAVLHRKDDCDGIRSHHIGVTNYPGGRFGEMLPHPIYLLQSFLGDDLQFRRLPLADKRSSFAWLPHDELLLSLRGPKGAGHVYVSFNAPRPTILANVYGSEKILRIDILNQSFLDFGPSKARQKTWVLDSLGMSGRLARSIFANVFRYAGREGGAYSIENIISRFR